MRIIKNLFVLLVVMIALCSCRMYEKEEWESVPIPQIETDTLNINDWENEAL